MRKRNNVKQLHRTAAHRKAMLNNMITSLFLHEKIESTVAKVKVAQRFAERLINRAKNQGEGAARIHNIRQASRVVKDKDILNKLFNDIGLRVKGRNGGYTRIIKTGLRDSDKSSMAIIELVDRVVDTKPEVKDTKAAAKKKVKTA